MGQKRAQPQEAAVHPTKRAKQFRPATPSTLELTPNITSSRVITLKPAKGRRNHKQDRIRVAPAEPTPLADSNTASSASDSILLENNSTGSPNTDENSQSEPETQRARRKRDGTTGVSTRFNVWNHDIQFQ